MSANRFETFQGRVVTPSDGTDLAVPADGLMVYTTAGDIVVITDFGETITLKTVPLMTAVHLRVTRVKSTGTTAVGILALYRPKS